MLSTIMKGLGDLNLAQADGRFPTFLASGHVVHVRPQRAIELVRKGQSGLAEIAPLQASPIKVTCHDGCVAFMASR